MPGEIPDVFPGRDVEAAGQIDAKPGVSRMRLADHPHSLHPLARRRELHHGVVPVHEPRIIWWFTLQEALDWLLLFVIDIALVRLQPERSVLEAQALCPEVLGSQEFGHSSLGRETQQVLWYLHVELVIADIDQGGDGLGVSDPLALDDVGAAVSGVQGWTAVLAGRRSE